MDGGSDQIAGSIRDSAGNDLDHTFSAEKQEKVDAILSFATFCRDWPTDLKNC